MIPGSIDLHVHCAPDVRPRKVTALELARAAQAAGMGGLLFKNHQTSTTPLASTVREATGFATYGGLVLNEAVRGFNPAAVEAAIRAGARLIWMPTHCAAHERAYRGLSGTGLSLNLPAVREILELIGGADLILGTGHLSLPEIRALVPTTREAGVRKILVNHPEICFLDFPLSFQQELAAGAVWFERCYMRANFNGGWETLARNIRATGVERNVLATDLGQPESPDPVAGLGELQLQLARLGFHDAELDTMSVRNPSALL